MKKVNGRAGSECLRLGFIGLGDMGEPMAHNLIDKGFDVTVFDVRQECLELAANKGAKVAKHLAEIADSCDIVGICVWSEEQLLSILYGEKGLFSSDARNLTLLIHSTVSPQTVQDIAATCANKGWQVLDVPVSGGRAASIAGKLTLMVGGSREVFSKCEPYFQAVGENIFYIAETPGAGEVAKLCNNLMALCNAYIVTEALKLGAAYGIAEDVVLDVAKVSTGNSWFVENRSFFDNIISTHSQPDVLSKDLWSAIDVAKEKGIELIIASVVAISAPRKTAERIELLRKRSDV